MTDVSVYRWLLCLCDPDGYADLPVFRLTLPQFRPLFELADEHGVTGAVLSNVQRVFQCDGPDRLLALASADEQSAIEEAIDEANQRWFSNVGMTLLLRQRSAEVIAGLLQDEFPVALVKGEDFADRLYGQPSLRPFRDIDLMLPRDAIDRVTSVMRELGFHLHHPGGKYNENYGERTWDSSTAPLIRVELHWNLITCPSQRRHSSLAFDELQWEQWGAAGLRATPESMLLIACVHAAISHRFDRLQHLCDIRQICRGKAGDLDCDWIREAARRNGLTVSLAGALEVAGRLLDEPVCHAALETLRLPVSKSYWRWLVSDRSLLHPETRISKLRRTIAREWMKRVA